MAEVLSCLEHGLGELLQRVGRLFIESVLEAEAEQLADPRSRRTQQRHAYRWGSERGYCLVDGQRVPIVRPRLRECGGNELPLGSYQLFQKATSAEETVWSNVMRGLSTRNYKEVLQQFADAYGLEKSTISEHFIAAPQEARRADKPLAYPPPTLCRGDRRHDFQRTAPGSGNRHRHARPQDRAGFDSRSDRECDRREWVTGSTGRARTRLHAAPFISAGWQQSVAGRRRSACGASGLLPALPGTQDPEYPRIPAGGAALLDQVQDEIGLCTTRCQRCTASALSAA